MTPLITRKEMHDDTPPFQEKRVNYILVSRILLLNSAVKTKKTPPLTVMPVTDPAPYKVCTACIAKPTPTTPYPVLNGRRKKRCGRLRWPSKHVKERCLVP